MIEIRDIEESIRYSCRHNPMYGEDLIKQVRDAFAIKTKIEYRITELNDLLSTEAGRGYMDREKAILEELLKLQNPNEVKQS